MNRGQHTHIPSLDGLRGLAALIVMVSLFSGLTHIFGDVLGRGAAVMGVMMFFMLSGFLLGHLYLDKAISAGALAEYVVRRLSHVFPLFLFVVVASYLSSQIFDDWKMRIYQIKTWEQALEHLYLIRAQSVMWTILVEIKFYAIFPLFWLVCSLSRKWGRVVIVVGVIAAFFYNDVTLQLGRHPDFIMDIKFGQTVRCSHYFLTGALIAVVMKTEWFRRVTEGVSELTWDCLFLISLGGIALLYPSISPFIPEYVTDTESLLTYRHMWANPIFLILIAST